MGAGPIGTPTSGLMLIPIVVLVFGDVVEVVAGSWWSSVRGRLGARPLLLLLPAFPRLRPLASPSSLRSSSLSSSIPFPSSSSPLRPRLVSRSSICEEGSGGSIAGFGRLRTRMSFRIRILMPWSAREQESGVDSTIYK